MQQKRKPQQLWTDYLVQRLHDEGYTQVGFNNATVDTESGICLETILADEDKSTSFIINRGIFGSGINRNHASSDGIKFDLTQVIADLKRATKYNQVRKYQHPECAVRNQFVETLTIGWKNGRSGVYAIFEFNTDGTIKRNAGYGPETTPEHLQPYLQPEKTGYFDSKLFVDNIVEYIKECIAPISENRSQREEKEELSRYHKRGNELTGKTIVVDDIGELLKRSQREIRLRSYEGQNIYEVYTLKKQQKTPSIRGIGYRLRGCVDKREIVPRLRRLFQRITPQEVRIIYQESSQRYAVYTR